MKTETFFIELRKSVAIKLFLILALIVGGGNLVWAGDYTETLVFNNTIPSGWINGGKYGNSIGYSVFTINTDNIETTNTYGTFSLTSESTSLTINRSQKIVVTAKVKSNYSSTSQHVTIRYTLDKSEDTGKASYSQLVKFDKSVLESQEEYVTLEYVVDTDGMKDGCRLQFLAQAAVINRIEIKSASSDLTIIDEDADPGEFKSSTPSSLTVKYTAVNGWNTICVPFQLRTWGTNYMPNIFGDGWKAYTLSAYDNGTLTFAQVAASGYLNANTPFLVYAPNATGTQTDLALSSTAVTYSASPSATVGTATFQGTYAPMSMEGKFGVTSAGQVMEGTSTANIKGYRAYFTGISAPAGARPTIVLVGGEETTDIGFVKMVDPEAKDVYSLSGQKVQKAGKGIYIVNGRKVVIK